MTVRIATRIAVPDAVERPVSPRASLPATASSSADRASDSATPVAPVARSPTTTSPVRSIGPGRRATTASRPIAVNPAVRASPQRTRARATVRFRQTNASPTMPNSTMRVSSCRPSGRADANDTPRTADATIAPTAIAVFWRTARGSRRMLASTMPAPVNARSSETIGSGRSPLVMAWATARRPANSAASIALRATRSAATVARASARRTSGSDPQAVDRDPGRPEPLAHGLIGLLDRDREDPMVRVPQAEERAGELRTEDRRDADERRAPRQATALAEEHGLGRVRGVGTEPRQDLEAPGERPWPAPERGTGTLVGDVVDPVRHEADLPPRVGGEPDELGGRGDHELRFFGVGLDPELVIGRDVHEEDGIETRRRLVDLRLQRAEPGRRLPVDLLARIAGPMLADAAEPQRVGQEAALRRGLGERAERRPVMVGDAQRLRVDDDRRLRVDDPVDLSEPEPVAAPQPDRTELVRATLRRAQRERKGHALVGPRREPRADRAARHAGRGGLGIDPLGQREADLEPRHRKGLAVGDDDPRREGIARHHARRRELELGIHPAERRPRGEERHAPSGERRGGSDDDDGLTGHRRDPEEDDGDRPGEESGPLDGHATGRGSSAGTGTRARTSLTTAAGVRPRIWASASRNKRCRSTAGAWRFTSSGST